MNTPTKPNPFDYPQFDDHSLIENLDIDDLNHAEKFLLATVSMIDGHSIELICGNGNRWALPKNYKDHGNVVCAYTKLRERNEITTPQN
jgi:hypothetical protein